MHFFQQISAFLSHYIWKDILNFLENGLKITFKVNSNIYCILLVGNKYFPQMQIVINYDVR